jgi:hypothetical protein
MSALPSAPDMHEGSGYVRLVPETDILVDALPLVQLSRAPFSFRESESPAQVARYSDGARKTQVVSGAGRARS